MKNVMNHLEHKVTGRKLSHKKLIESEERYKRIADSFTDYLYSVKIENGRVTETFHNDASIAVTGYSPDEFAADPYLWINIVPPEERAGIVEKIQKIYTGDKLSSIEHRIICKDGTIRWVSDTTIPKYDSNYNLISYDGIIKDITERKLAEENIMQDQQRYYALIQTTFDGFCVTDYAGNIIEVNDSYCRMSGYSKEQLLQMSIMDLDFQESNDNTKKRIDEMIRIGRNRFESIHKCADGSLINVEVSTTVLKDKNVILSFLIIQLKEKLLKMPFVKVKIGIKCWLIILPMLYGLWI